MAVVDDSNPGKDCAISMACGVGIFVVLKLALVADAGIMLERATVIGNASLPCSDRVMVTKEVVGAGVNELERGMDKV
jgi:hypothetical protein